MEEFIKDIGLYWQPYLISQVVSILFLVAAWRNTRIARALFSLIFLWASITNLYTISVTPDAYLDYANLAISWYHDFINGWFSDFDHIMVPAIALGQFSIATGMILKGCWVKWACIGAIIFLMSIAPLMVGSAFPFSITVSTAAWLILKRDKKNYLWKSGLSAEKTAQL